MTFLRIVNIRLERAGKKIGERRSVMALHLYYFPADGERSFGEGGEEDWREKVSNVSPSTLLSCGWWRFVWRRRERGLERGG